ncbi:MAG: DUF3134 family protein [Jaaginema sp. PMC 1079.18]|nr:DUF3134 family protein [Jaaginema sp. PMC 1080.18]MEC4849991.1 DUF3134 family protein [Jaaginema sp. PMC 1079.18]MEC4865179.1 DUF3134 family protein [Jaaginema sp. PMC 1078.18]
MSLLDHFKVNRPSMESEQADLTPEITLGDQVLFENRALSQEARYEPATVIPLKRGESLLKWLASNNRLAPREKREEDSLVEEEEELSGLIDDDKDDDDDDDMDDFDE